MAGNTRALPGAGLDRAGNCAVLGAISEVIMAFVGAVPRPVIDQIVRVVPFGEWRHVCVGCSGSFRFDKAVHDAHPSVTVHSNDVSLFSCSLGALATGDEFPIAFTGSLLHTNKTVK